MHIPNETFTIYRVSSERSTSDSIYYLIMTINFTVVCELVAVFGTVTNIINIVVFFRMGFVDQINISLFGLAVSDLFSLVTLHWHNLCYNPFFKALDLPFDPQDTQYLTAGIPHVLFTRITASLTAFITLERCLCIYLPLQVKTVLNSGRVKIVVSSIYSINIVCLVPFYYANRLGMKFFKDRNKTLIGLVFGEDRVLIDSIVFTIVNIIVPVITFIVVVVCTLVIVVKMKEKSRWRAKAAATVHSSDNSYERDQKVSRMVLTISLLFIVCFAPTTAIFVSMVIEPEFSIQGDLSALLFTLCSFSYILEALNSSLNIFIYFNMSKKFREAFSSVTRNKI